MFLKLKFSAISLFLMLCIAVPNAYSQLGGKGAFMFLRNDPSAMVTAFGGNVISVPDVDLSTALMNPAVMTDIHHNNLSMNYNNYFGDINYGNVSYAYKFNEKENSWIYGLQLRYMDYGKFDGYDYTGESTGTFGANDLLLSLSASKAINDKFRFGASLKTVYSVLETYVSTGIGADLGAFYNDTAHNFSMGLTLRNIGFQMVPYRNTKREAMPFDINYAFTVKPKHAPFRVTVMMHNLQKPDLTYEYQDPFNRRLDENNEEVANKVSLLGKTARHFTIGGELLLSKNFNVRFSYNHNRRQELGTAVKKGVAGFSWGASFKVKKIKFEYGSGGYFPGFNTNMFSVILDLNEFYH